MRLRRSPAIGHLALATLLPAAFTGVVSGQAAPAGVDSELFASLRWRSIGPARGGIAQAVVGHPSNPFVFYQGVGGGGVWKTDDAGLTWSNVSDGHFHTGSIGAIALAPSDPEVVYAGTGEACMRTTTSPGEGVYRSDDGGATWRHLGLEATEHIARVVVHPTDPDIAYVAAVGRSFAPNPERGVYRTRDGGRTWDRVLFRGEDAAAIDLAMAPNDPGVLYAALWDTRNYPWGNRNGGPASGIFKSTDGGDTWTELTGNPGLPGGLKGRIGIDVSRSMPNRVWALMTAEGEGGGTWPPAGSGIAIPEGWASCRDYVCAGNGLYRSDDGGATWERVNDDLNFFSRPWYYTHVTADPVDADKAYILVNGEYVVEDGGRSTRRFRGGDTHDMWIDPANPGRIIVGTDQGAQITLNGGATWSSTENQTTGKFYRVTTDDRFPYRVYAGQQDGPTHSIPSWPDPTMPADYQPAGGENAVVAVDRRDPDITYGGDHHWVFRQDRHTGENRVIAPWPENTYGWGPADVKYRYVWWFPVHVSRHDPSTVYVGAQVLFRSRDEGQSWDVISPDLTLADPATLETTLPSDPGETWGITRENLTQRYSGLVTFSDSPVRAGVVWTGSDDGVVSLTRDDGATWLRVTPPDLPRYANVATVEASPHDPAAAYVAATRYQLGDDTPFLYRTRDYGHTWTRITGGIPSDDYARTIREDPEVRGLLYAGTERGGVYVSFNDGESWQSLRLNLPVVPVWDLQVKGNDLIAATHGRSYWILDDVSVLRQLHRDPSVQGLRLFAPATTVRYRGATAGAGPGPWRGAAIRWHMDAVPSGDVTLDILDAAGGPVASFSSGAPADPGDPLTPRRIDVERLRTRAGANSFVWDLRHPSIAKIPSALIRLGDPEGPLAVPGRYTVRLSAGGRTVTQPLDVVADPRTPTTAAEFQEQLDLALEIRDRTESVYRTVAEMRSLRAQMDRATGAAPPTAAAARELGEVAAGIGRRLWEIEDVLIQFRVETSPPASQSLIAWPVKVNDKLSTLLSFLEDADARPTEQDRALFQELAAQADAQRDALLQLVRGDVARANELLRSMDLPPLELRFLLSIS